MRYIGVVVAKGVLVWRSLWMDLPWGYSGTQGGCLSTLKLRAQSGGRELPGLVSHVTGRAQVDPTFPPSTPSPLAAAFLRPQGDSLGDGGHERGGFGQ